MERQCEADLWQGWPLQSLLSLPLLPVGSGLPGPVQCWISFRRAKEEQSDLETGNYGYGVVDQGSDSEKHAAVRHWALVGKRPLDVSWVIVSTLLQRDGCCFQRHLFWWAQKNLHTLLQKRPTISSSYTGSCEDGLPFQGLQPALSLNKSWSPSLEGSARSQQALHYFSSPSAALPVMNTV